MLDINKLYAAALSSDYRLKIEKVENVRIRYSVYSRIVGNRYRITGQDRMSLSLFSSHFKKLENLSDVIVVE